MANSNGPGSSSKRGRSAAGRATAKGGSPKRTASLGRYTDPEEGGRYTKPIPKDTRVSPRWYGPVLLALLIIGVLVILFNYVGVFGTPSGWTLLIGLAIIAAGFGMATRYR